MSLDPADEAFVHERYSTKAFDQTYVPGSSKLPYKILQTLRLPLLRLMEDFHQHQVEGAVSEALRLGAISFDAVKMLLLARLENRPARLDLTFYPYLPATTVGTTDPRAYLGLIAGSGFVSLAGGAQA